MLCSTFLFISSYLNNPKQIQFAVLFILMSYIYLPLYVVRALFVFLFFLFFFFCPFKVLLTGQHRETTGGGMREREGG